MIKSSVFAFKKADTKPQPAVSQKSFTQSVVYFCSAVVLGVISLACGAVVVIFAAVTFL